MRGHDAYIHLREYIQCLPSDIPWRTLAAEHVETLAHAIADLEDEGRYDPGMINMAYERAREYFEDHGIDVPVHLRSAIAYALGHIELGNL